MEGFSLASTTENYFKRIFAFQGKSSHHQHNPIFATTKISRKVHSLRKAYVINCEFRFKGDWVLTIWEVNKASVFWGKGNHLTRCGSTGFQDRRIPSPVPGARRNEILIQCSVRSLEVAVRATCVENFSAVVEAAVPFPGSCLVFQRWVTAFNSWD